ncbi:hypothetical protein MITS9509_00610 [Synechococcus sp. MIT S9509]|uniref:hypothetical protein n=1 Tax=unclassified Synechococcus TaxID=2626047 RepID=UPI0007BAF7BF|nr:MULTISPECIES: hypothetical protein [unclassified Synechococcus]KZR87813.1 hypothetical protein MITS9504_00237 [Synechococcus sp. MIT S9504]KZR93315.1 hypothetical protein MITS9509_00610 [Synechococcus sp. MIT S9509]
MLIIEIELLIALVLVLIAITRRTAITQWLANRRYQIGLKRARKLFQLLDQKDGQNAITNHLLEEGHFLRSKRRVGDFYCIPDEDIDGEKQDIMLRMSHKNEPRWVALRRLYLSSIQDGYFKKSVIDIPALWDREFDVAYDHWKDNLSGTIQRDEQEDAWIVA